MNPDTISSIIIATASIIALFISVLSLRQNSKMIEGSTRPYISIYGASTIVNGFHYYIIIKNYGQTSAKIDSFIYDFDLSAISFHPSYEPFENIEGTTLCPGQSLRTVIDYKKAIAIKETVHFIICYSSRTHSYEEDFSLRFNANSGNLEARSANNDKTGIIAEVLQDVHIKSL